MRLYFVSFELVSYMYTKKKLQTTFERNLEKNNLDLFLKYSGSITNYLPVS